MSAPVADASLAPLTLSELLAESIAALTERALALDIRTAGALSRDELIYTLLDARAALHAEVLCEGVLDVLLDGCGFLRTAANSYLPSVEDVIVSPEAIRRFALATGDQLRGPVRPPYGEERHLTLAQIQAVNGGEPDATRARIPFDELTALYPEQRYRLETTPDALTARVIDLVAPIGKGQRALITSPPKAGKTILLKELANAISTNHPEAVLLVLLIDERPEEVTDMQRSVRGEVIASTFDEPAQRHVQVAEIVLERAKRLVEHGRDVVILLDSITRLARAHNTVTPASGKILSGGVDANALQRPKRFFGAARNTEEAGSLTIIGTALIDTGSRMDEVIFEEFTGTGNSKIVLDRKLADRRTFPAIDLNRSATRREELLLEPAVLNRMFVLRKLLAPLTPVESMEFLLEKIRQAESNQAFLESMNG